MVEDMATDTWLWVRSILPVSVIFGYFYLVEIRDQGRMLYVYLGQVVDSA
jgi:hypothetical protein